MFGFRKRKNATPLDDVPEEELIKYVLAKPALREKILEAIHDEVKDVLDATLVNAIKLANERPSKWWEWLFLLAAGALAGVGIGIVLAIKGGIIHA